MNPTYFIFSVPFALGVAVAACGHSYSQASAPTTTSTAVSAPASEKAVERISAARCDREMRCGNVGAGKSYVSPEGCTTEVKGKTMNDLTTSACPRGIDEMQLDKCLADIKGERCENVLDALSRLANCRTGALCPK
jgi:hypothetical protein